MIVLLFIILVICVGIVLYLDEICKTLKEMIQKMEEEDT